MLWKPRVKVHLEARGAFGFEFEKRTMSSGKFVYQLVRDCTMGVGGGGGESGLAQTFHMFGRGVPLEQGARSQVCWSQHLAGVCYLMSESGGVRVPFGLRLRW